MNFCLSYYAGGGGFSLGAASAGFQTLGVEFDPSIAELYRQNVGECITADVTTLNPHSLEFPSKSERLCNGDILIWQLSPECKMFSRANTAAKADQAKALATDSATSLTKIYWHEQIIEPDVIILENVEDYANYQGYIDFCFYLEDRGYKILSKSLVLNAADFGVPQSRRRLIMIAVKGIPLPKIEQTHAQFSHGQIDLFSEPKLPWVGWYEAIEDLLDELPRSQLTAKQQQAIKALGFQTQLVDQQNSKSVRLGYKTRGALEPSFTLGCNAQAKAFLVERVGAYNSPKIRSHSEPCWTLRSHLGDDGKNGSRTKVIDAVLGIDVRSLNTRALARLQSFPDWYQWSGKAALDTKVIGNSVPPLLAQRLVQSVTNDQ